MESRRARCCEGTVTCSALASPISSRRRSSAPWSWAFQLLSNAAAGAATVSDLIKEIGLVPAKAPYLSRLLRFLAFFGLFEEDDEESASAESQTVYKLTPTSRLLVQEPLLLFDVRLVPHAAAVHAPQHHCVNLLRPGALVQRSN